ncbi:MAG TPA: chemotaxis protein CheX [Accumulibacter sp.]|uniref:Chemotaxis protein CheX n=2 Tax=Candidatus Accumulibacter TaxID=327159 RepID=A0A7D5STW6_9PROT|nr:MULTISPECIES: chemotaxis protein CheX [Candidatus Accumulibacter]HNG54947.1 chemotaxis protein CheX [Nitrospira sp.]MBL8399811.1 chemotaxis protein CheX [Accumulibacter sp.]MBN8519709.1 chemotaxis protein CheX [Accumulibacter sp.]MBO3711681.1 chemotaxis protein CheX [Accumulibacter sp.]MCM8623991.1 chemotaxis protein CheX [Accumulibacter sp.]
MTEAELRIFIDIVQHYFEQQTGRPAEMGTPFLGDQGTLPVLDFTGLIGISGNRHGCVYFTATAALLRQLLVHGGETDVSLRNLADLAGEIANTISGNARRMFGHEFIISVPDVITDPHQQIALPANVKAYVIPLSWQQEEAALVVSVV